MKKLPLILVTLAQLGFGACNVSLEATAESPQSSSVIPSMLSSQNPDPPIHVDSDYKSVIDKTVAMVHNPQAQNLAQQFGLNILNITWEDTGRYKDSSVGPNISDMTIQVQQLNPETNQQELSLMPVIRHPNFSDESADVALEQFFLLTGNEKGQDLQRVSLKDFLGNIRTYLHEPDSWLGEETSLLAERDSHILVSAQACFLPIPQGGIAKFNPVLFNYQSYEGDPAILTILATREGTSVTIIDNKRDGFEAGTTWGQRLFFNQNGERASLTGQRISDFQTLDEGTQNAQTSSETVEEEGLNLVMMIQVPLKQKNPMVFEEEEFMSLGSFDQMPLSAPNEASDVEAAVIGHGEVEGPFTEIDGLNIERDPRFPIRVTVQFYQGTSNGIVSAQDMEAIKAQIDKVYEDADYVGSLVVDGDTQRPTEYEGLKEEPSGWWDKFWQRYEENIGQSKEEAMEMFRRLQGRNLTK